MYKLRGSMWCNTMCKSPCVMVLLSFCSTFRLKLEYVSVIMALADGCKCVVGCYLCFHVCEIEEGRGKKSVCLCGLCSQTVLQHQQLKPLIFPSATTVDNCVSMWICICVYEQQWNVTKYKYFLHKTLPGPDHRVTRPTPFWTNQVWSLQPAALIV